MKFNSKILSFIYTLFIVFSSVQSAKACVEAESTHSCCCSALSSCSTAGMDCCVGEDESEDSANEHAISSIKLLKDFTALKGGKVANVQESYTFQTQVSAFLIKPPPKLRLYLSLNKLILYA